MADKFLRIESLIKKNLMEIIQFKVKNPHLGMVFIPEVKVSKDFSYAKIYVSFLNESEEKEGLAALNHSKGYIRSLLANSLDIRRIPELSFVLDEGYKREARIEEILRKKD